MKNTSDILGIIPARGGSKRVPRKNLVSVNGRPLLAYTCKAALESTLLTRTVLSTDDEEIAAVGRSCGVEVPCMRSANLATDDADSLAVVMHVLETLKEREQYVPEIVVLLQPTSPLRTGAHIDEAVQLLKDSDADAAASVIAVPHAQRPMHLLHIEEGKLLPAVPGANHDATEVYAYNGAIYVFRTSTFGKSTHPFGDHVLPYIMHQRDSLDIDTPLDVSIAEFLLRQI